MMRWWLTAALLLPMQASAQFPGYGAEGSGDGTPTHILAMASTGLSDGGTLTVNGGDNTKFDVAAGDGVVIDATTAPMSPASTAVSFGPFVAVAPTFLLTHPVTYIMVDSAGSLVQLSAEPSSAQRRDNIDLGVVVHSNNVIVNTTNNLPTMAFNAQLMLSDLTSALGLINASGNRISPNGGNLNINKSSGALFSMGTNFTADPKAPNLLSIPSAVAATFRYRNQTGSEGADVTLIDPSTYDLAGVTTAVPAPNNATLQRVYVFPTGLIRIQRGQTIYSTLSDAIDAIASDAAIVEGNISSNGILLAIIALKKNTTQLDDASDARFFNASRLGDLLAGGSSAVGTLQTSYDNSAIPHVITSTLLGALTVERGSAADADDILVGRNAATATTFSVTGDGRLTFSETGAGAALKTGAIADGEFLKRSGTAIIGGAAAEAPSWDWTAGVPPALLADWADVTTVDADVNAGVGLATRDQILGGQAIRMTPGAANFEGGVVRAVAGSFTWAFRFGFIPARAGQLDNSTGGNWMVLAAYHDGAASTLAGAGARPSYGTGIEFSGKHWEDHHAGAYTMTLGFGEVITNVAASAIDTVSWDRHSMLDVWLDYDAATDLLTMWMAPAGQLPIKTAEQTIATATDAGYIGIWVATGASPDLDHRAILLHATSAAAVPGFE